MAERVGFEPTAPYGVTGFQDQLLKPLGHLSITVLLYQIGPIISNNVISYKKKAGSKCSDPKKLDFLFRATKTGCSEFFMLQ